jgi:hypothetical protein
LCQRLSLRFKTLSLFSTKFKIKKLIDDRNLRSRFVSLNVDFWLSSKLASTANSFLGN